MADNTDRRSRLGTKRQLPSGRWEVAVTHGYREDGKPRRIYDTVDTEANADRRIVELAAQMDARPDLQAGITLRTVWTIYQSDKGARLATKTLADYESYMDKTWLPLMGDSDISTIRFDDIQRVILSMRTRHLADHAKRVMSSVMSYAVSRGWLTDHPLRGRKLEYPGDTGSDWDDESVWDDDPFSVIEGKRDVWGAETVLDAFGRIRGLPLEPVWLAMVGGGLRMEEAFALRGMDVRRVKLKVRPDLDGKPREVEVTQVAVHHARTDMDERKRTKTKQSVRIAAIAEPFGERYWELAQSVDPKELVCKADPANQNKRWRSYFDKPPKYHKRMSDKRKVAGKLHGLPYVPLSRMRATHSTLMQEAGVLDSINAAAHGHSERVAYSNYQRGGVSEAAERTGRYLRGTAKV